MFSASSLNIRVTIQIAIQTAKQRKRRW